MQGKVQDVIGYGIASVYTPPENRGKGYARHMMSLLHWVLAPRSSSTGDYALTRDMFPTTWGEPPSPVASCGDAKFSVLYSDIGTFYQLCGTTGGSDGWVVRDPIGTVWDVSKFSARPTDTNTQIEWLSEDACKTLWAEDAKAMRDDLSNYTPATKTLFTFRPDTGVATFQLRRTVFFLPGQSAPMPQKWGVCISNQNQVTGPSQAFATWTIDIRPEPPSTLIVTRLRSTVELFPTLVELIIAAAKEMDIGQVEVWNLPPKFATLASDLHGVTSTREDHLNAMKWYGPESVDEVEWVFNEKYVNQSWFSCNPADFE